VECFGIMFQQERVTVASLLKFVQKNVLTETDGAGQVVAANTEIS
jgi:hypothetical protein